MIELKRLDRWLFRLVMIVLLTSAALSIAVNLKSWDGFSPAPNLNYSNYNRPAPGPYVAGDTLAYSLDVTMRATTLFRDIYRWLETDDGFTAENSISVLPAAPRPVRRGTKFHREYTYTIPAGVCGEYTFYHSAVSLASAAVTPGVRIHIHCPEN